MTEHTRGFINAVRKNKQYTIVIDVGATSGIVVSRPGQTWFGKTYQPKGRTIIHKATDLSREIITIAKNEDDSYHRYWVAVVRWPGAARTKR